MNTLKKFWTYIVAAFGILLGLFFLERGQRKQAEAKLENQEFIQKDKLLEQTQKLNEASIQDEQTKMDNLRKDHDKDIKDDKTQLTKDEVESYWSKK